MRSALAMSAITGHNIRIVNIRANRPKPGLANQHLTGLRVMKDVCEANVSGDRVGSTGVSFEPGEIRHGNYIFEVGTAGSVTLVLQTILPALASVKGESTIRVTGGTDVKWSPPVDYYRLVLFPILKKIGLDCRLDIRRRGYFPRGGGEVGFNIISQGNIGNLAMSGFSGVKGIRGMVNITGLPMNIADRIRDSILKALPDELACLANIEIEHADTGPSQGVGVVLAASDGERILGSSSLGERGKPAERVGQEAVKDLLSEVNCAAGADVHASDQLLPYLALGETGNTYTCRTLTKHAETNVWTIEKFLEKTFTVKKGQIVSFCRI